MKPAALLMSLAFAAICGADTLRISEVAEQAGDDTERLTLVQDGKEEILFVKKQAVIGDGDVKNAYPSVQQEHSLSVSLTEEGEKKIKAVTSRMRLSEERLAIVVDGKLLNAPVVQAVLGKNFEINGLRDMDSQQLAELARKMGGMRKDDPDGGKNESIMPPEPRPLPPEGEGPGLLKMIMPEINRDSPDPDAEMIRLLEGVSFPEPEQAVNPRDLTDLVTLVMMCARSEEVKQAAISKDCPLVEMLARHFPEVADLRKKTADGRIRMSRLNDLFLPYAEGGKPFPAPRQAGPRTEKEQN